MIFRGLKRSQASKVYTKTKRRKYSSYPKLGKLISFFSVEPKGRIDTTRRLEDTYDIIETLGEGTYGQVFKAKERDTENFYALKRLRMEGSSGNNAPTSFSLTAVREIKIHDSIQHDNIIDLKEIITGRIEDHILEESRNDVFLVFDLMDGDLSKYLESMNRQIPLAETKHFMKQLLLGLEHCHNRNILHRDLKLNNLLINFKGELKIADFGLGSIHLTTEDYNLTNRVITLWYRPPELLLGSIKYDYAVDMWSVGCILCELLTGSVMFPGNEELDQMDKIFAVLGRPTTENMPEFTTYKNHEKVSFAEYTENKMDQWFETNQITDEIIKDFINHLITLNPKNRFNATEALNHVFLKDIEIPTMDFTIYQEYIQKKKEEEEELRRQKELEEEMARKEEEDEDEEEGEETAEEGECTTGILNSLGEINNNGEMTLVSEEGQAITPDTSYSYSSQLFDQLNEDYQNYSNYMDDDQQVYYEIENPNEEYNAVDDDTQQNVQGYGQNSSVNRDDNSSDSKKRKETPDYDAGWVVDDTPKTRKRKHEDDDDNNYSYFQS